MRLLIHILLEKLKRSFREQDNPARTFALEGDLLLSLQKIALKEQKSEDEVAHDLVAHAILSREKAEYFRSRWEELSPREQHVAALCCLGYNNNEIANHLSISLNTVKSHIRNVCQRLGVQSKADLRKILAEWDFHDWDTLARPPVD